MDSQEFATMFEQEFAQPLLEQGFDFVGRSKSMRYVQENRELRILRQGGRLARPGSARSVICFRHTFLRPINSDDPSKEPIYVQDCPRKLIFDDFDGWRQPKLDYQPENLGRWRIHTLNYSEADARIVSECLGKLAVIVTKRILPWVNSRTEAEELSQIRKFGENAWCEKRWIEDYEQFLSEQHR
ncbi:hypothetical protein [Roseovarius sp. 2305UL8-3]|uniref:hypothetical protein n=1 Tax=Roseovarius conchicola TaxID=3121636 RepID=UPI00352889E8